MDKICAVYRGTRKDEWIPRILDVFWNKLEDFQGIFLQTLDIAFHIFLACLLLEPCVKTYVVIDVVGKTFQVILTVVLDTLQLDILLEM